MDDVFAILLGAGVAGGVLLLVKRRQAAEQPKGSKACDIAEAAAKQAGLPFNRTACEGLLGLGSKLVDAVFDNSVAENNKEVSARDANNRKLNGATDIPNRVGLQGSTLRFVNGCVPYAGAPGWSKCAPGTQSMWMHDTHKAIGASDYTTPAFRTQAERDAFMRDGWQKLPSSLRGAQVGRVRVTPSSLLTGSADPKYPDPATTGYPIAGRGWSGYVKGRPVTCSDGNAPALWDAAGVPTRDQREGVPPCAPGGISTFTPSSAGATPIGGTSVQTTLACGPNNSAPPGYTWDAGGFWRRLAVNELPNPGPCAPRATTLLTPILGVIR